MSTDAVAGNLFFRKGLTSGGIEELLQMLGATADAIEAGRHDETRVAEALTEQRGYVEMWTAAVNRLTDTATLPELVDERRQHDGERMLSQVERVVDVVNDFHPSLRVPATALLNAARSYLAATQRLLERIVEEGASTRDFSLLDPADYAQLATTGTVEQLAAVFDRIVWDPPRPAMSPSDVVAAMRSYRPQRRRQRRPPVDAPSVGPSSDPLEGIEERLEVRRRQREHAAELLLQGEASIELSAHMRAAPWPAALRIIVDVAALDKPYDSLMHPNEERTRDIYEAMARGDGRALAQYLTPQTRWVIAGGGPIAGVYTGTDEIFGFWKKTAEQTGGGLRLQLRDVLANDERAVALVDVSGHRNGRELNERQAVVIEWSDEVITSATFIYEDPRAYNEFWAD